MSFVANPSKGTIDFVFKIQKNRIQNLVPFSIKLLFKNSEVDQELECEIHQTKYKVMIGCDMDCPP
jgi:hypothetical protein